MRPKRVRREYLCDSLALTTGFLLGCVCCLRVARSYRLHGTEAALEQLKVHTEQEVGQALSALRAELGQLQRHTEEEVDRSLGELRGELTTLSTTLSSQLAESRNANESALTTMREDHESTFGAMRTELRQVSSGGVVAACTCAECDIWWLSLSLAL